MNAPPNYIVARCPHPGCPGYLASHGACGLNAYPCPVREALNIVSHAGFEVRLVNPATVQGPAVVL